MALQKAVAKNPDFEFLPSGKIHCKLTSHDLMPKLEEFQKYIKGKSYLLGKERNFDLSEFEPYLVPYKKNQNFMFCRLTGRKVTKLSSVIQKHMNGRKFLRKKEEHETKLKETEERQKKKAAEKAKRITAQKAQKALKEQSNGAKNGKAAKTKKGKGKKQAEMEEEGEDFNVEAFDAEFDSDMDEEGQKLLDESDGEAIDEEEVEETKANGHGKIKAKAKGGNPKKRQIEEEVEENEEDYEDIEAEDDDENEEEEEIKPVKKVPASKKISKPPKKGPTAAIQKLKNKKIKKH